MEASRSPQLTYYTENFKGQMHPHSAASHIPKVPRQKCVFLLLKIKVSQLTYSAQTLFALKPPFRASTQASTLKIKVNLLIHLKNDSQSMSTDFNSENGHRKVELLKSGLSLAKFFRIVGAKEPVKYFSLTLQESTNKIHLSSFFSVKYFYFTHLSQGKFAVRVFLMKKNSFFHFSIHRMEQYGTVTMLSGVRVVLKN